MKTEDFYMVDYITDSFDTNPKLLPDGQLVELLMRRPETQLDIRTIRTSPDAKVVEDAKRRLPAIIWGGHFTQGRRRKGECLSSGLFCTDIDHIAQDPEGARQYYADHFGGREDELGIVFAHVSPSGTGLHVACLLQPGLKTIADNQAWLAQQTKSEYDPVCKDLGRIFYLSTHEDIIYNDIEQ